MRLELEFDGEVIHWRGPAPYFFVRLPDAETAELAAVAAELTYGWGCIPAEVTLGESTWKTSLFPKDGGFLVPLKKRYRDVEGVELGDLVHVLLSLGHRAPDEMLVQDSRGRDEV